MSDLNFLSATAMAEQIWLRQLSPVELVDAHLARIERVNPKLNAFIHVSEESARAEAVAGERTVSAGDSVGPLHGVPISIKSSLEVTGMPFEAGSKLRAGVRGKEDAVLVSRLRKAGAIVLGVTNTPELLMAWESDNLLYGRTNNPWDLSRTAGGSSGGEAAAIASGCSAGGVGSDGGGSIREPAHFCGICGLKPTPGRIPTTGHYPVSAGPFALLGVVGPMARNVGDLKLLFEVVQGPDDGDAQSAPVSLRWPDFKTVKNIRVGYFEDDDRTPVTPETRAAIRTATEGLRRTGFTVEPFRPQGLESARKLWWQFFGVAGGMMLGSMLAGHEPDTSPILLQFLERVKQEPAHTGESLLNAWIQRDLLRTEILKEMREFPILLCPVAAIPAFKHGERSWQVEGKTVEYLDAWSYCEWFNLLGNPAAVVPVGKSPEGLPIGVQIVGRPWEEEMVLSIAEVVEKEAGGWRIPQTT